MINVKLCGSPHIFTDEEILVVPNYSGENITKTLQDAGLNHAPWSQSSAVISSSDDLFSKQLAQFESTNLVNDSGIPQKILTIDLGPRDRPINDVMHIAGRAIGKALADSSKFTIVLSGLGPITSTGLKAMVEGIIIRRFDAARFSEPEKDHADIRIIISSKDSNRADLDNAIKIGLVAAFYANWVRNLVELPAAELPPLRFAQVIKERAEFLGISCELWDKDALAKQNFGGTLGVGAGSTNVPVAIILETPSQPGGRRLGLAGKGVTFDSGGINLKSDRAEIAYMKSDMAGAASVAGAIFAAIELGASPDVIAVLPMAENMPGGNALRPGDIVRHPNGVRTEVLDTDCEGRLLLADAISYLRARKVSDLVDVATLSDGGGVGPLLWGYWSNNDVLSAAVSAAGQQSGDPGWRLPLHDVYRKMVSSRIADLANAPSGIPDTGLTAATYLSRFAGETPWVHIDNGSSAYLEYEIGNWPAGATGSPMRALLQLLLDRT
ncbi:MAG: hypothetical protein PF483_13625 [Halothiobacillus sp.]|jgi:leucyl aminopeptidase|nr:hypothetical protein [Halothiobacillus sp.]